MSLQSAKEFLVRIATEVKAAEEAQAAHEKALVSLGESLGYRFSATDLQQAMADVDELDELSHQELAGLAGGVGLPPRGSIKPIGPMRFWPPGDSLF